MSNEFVQNSSWLPSSTVFLFMVLLPKGVDVARGEEKWDSMASDIRSSLGTGTFVVIILFDETETIDELLLFLQVAGEQSTSLLSKDAQEAFFSSHFD